MQTTIMLDQILEKVDAMTLEEQELVIEILRNRYKEKRREEILENVKKTLEEYEQGLASKGTVADLQEEGDSL